MKTLNKEELKAKLASNRTSNSKAAADKIIEQVKAELKKADGVEYTAQDYDSNSKALSWSIAKKVKSAFGPEKAKLITQSVATEKGGKRREVLSIIVQK